MSAAIELANKLKVMIGGTLTFWDHNRFQSLLESTEVSIFEQISPELFWQTQ